MITIEEFRKDLVQMLNIASDDVGTALGLGMMKPKSQLSDDEKANIIRCTERFRVLAGIYEIVVGEEWPADEDRTS